MFARLLGRRRARAETASRHYAAIVAHARTPYFYSRMDVADSVDGRFDMIALHVVLLTRRLDRIRPEGPKLGQAMFGVVFDDMDRNLREMGVGDLGVGRRVKTMAKALFGRARAYGDALDGKGDLEAAVARNIYRAGEERPAAVPAMAGYVRAAAAALDAQDDDALLSGHAVWPDPAGTAKGAA